MTSFIIRVYLPQHLQVLAKAPREVELQICKPITLGSTLSTLENRFPVLRGTLRDQFTLKRRPMVRFFACNEDVSQASDDWEMPESVTNGTEGFYIIGAIAGGT